jgi:hypothetical protein
MPHRARGVTLSKASAANLRGGRKMKTLQESLMFFAGEREKRHPVEAFGRFRAMNDPSSAFQTGPSGQNTAVTVNQKAPDLTPAAVLSDAQTAYNYLTSMTGLVSAFMRKQADTKKNPDILFDAKLWETTVEHIPLWDYTNLHRETFSKSLTGIEISTEFLAQMVGFAIDIAASAADIKAFTGFLTGLGDKIKAGSTTNNKGFETVNITWGVKFEDKGSAGLQMVPWINAYFIIFSESNKEIYTTCGSYQKYNYNFEYGLINGIWDYQQVKNTPASKASIDSLIAGSVIDDIKNSQNYFGGVVNTPKS